MYYSTIARISLLSNIKKFLSSSFISVPEYFSKITFSVVVGNHIENAYDKFINKFNGRIVGIKEKECLLSDGNFYDLKMYEIINNNPKKFPKILQNEFVNTENFEMQNYIFYRTNKREF